MKIEDLSNWEERDRMPRMGMGGDNGVRYKKIDNRLTEKLHKRQKLIHDNINNPDLQKLIDQANELNKIMRDAQEMYVKKLHECEELLENSSGDNYEPYYQTHHKYISTKTYEDYLKRNNLN